MLFRTHGKRWTRCTISECQILGSLLLVIWLPCIRLQTEYELLQIRKTGRHPPQGIHSSLPTKIEVNKRNQDFGDWVTHQYEERVTADIPQFSVSQQVCREFSLRGPRHSKPSFVCAPVSLLSSNPSTLKFLFWNINISSISLYQFQSLQLYYFENFMFAEQDF